MRFGISATSLIEPKNFRTRLRPVNVCAIVPLSILYCDGKRGRLSERPHPIATIRTGVGAARFYVIRVEPEPPHSSHLIAPETHRDSLSRWSGIHPPLSVRKGRASTPKPSHRSPSSALSGLLLPEAFLRRPAFRPKTPGAQARPRLR